MKLSRPQYGLEQQIVQAIYALREKKSSQLFRDPVDGNKVLDYYQIIKKPMDLSKILTKLKNGDYEYSNQIYEDLQLIILNCQKYNRAQPILKKADQFKDCIKTVWTNFKKQLQKKNINYNQQIIITQDNLKRVVLIQQKRNKKKIPALHFVIQQDKKNILPQSNILPPIMQLQKDKEQLPPNCQFEQHKYQSMDRQTKKQLLTLQLDPIQITKQFEKISQKKLRKYRKIIKKKLIWFDQKIIKKCLNKKNFQKMQVPKHLNLFIQNGNIAQDLSIRKLQMYIKKITYWVEDNSNILSDYMKDKFVQTCKAMKKCILRVIKYKKLQRGKNQLDLNIDTKNITNQRQPQVGSEQQKQDDNYQNKMKQFKRMLEKDREKSTKRDTKIILRNQNGLMQVYDWTSDKKQERGIRKEGGGATRLQQVDNDQKKKLEERKREELRKDEEFIQDYSKKSNVLLVAKYEDSLCIDWEVIKHRNSEFPKQISLNYTDDDNQ